MTAMPKKSRRLLGLLPPVLLSIAFVTAKPWLMATIGGQMVSWVGVALVASVVIYSVYFSIRRQRGLDEVEKAGAEFSTHWGLVAGMMTFALLFVLPPVQDVATDFVRNWADDPNAAREVVVRAMAIAVGGVAILQGIATVVMKAIWWKTRR
jgi:hypothetical protein